MSKNDVTKVCKCNEHHHTSFEECQNMQFNPEYEITSDNENEPVSDQKVNQGKQESSQNNVVQAFNTAVKGLEERNFVNNENVYVSITLRINL